ncbi:hypothetical protein ACFC1B_06990 [Streptomyces xiamenensis]|uniref:hypothetical protein n=1 Tax=Streptomyces xiamenensis TaxID=408015 RepID=UPI0035E260D8
MRLTTTLAALTLATADLIGTAGAATAQESSWYSTQFYADDNGAGLAGAQGSVSPAGVQHADLSIWADNTSVSGGVTDSEANWNNG